jgi:hypothetical protein
MKKNNKIKTLIIGFGQIGMLYDINNKKKFINHSSVFHFHKKFHLLGGVDSNLKKRLIFKKKYKLPAFKNLKEAKNNTRPDLIVVSTPTDNHYKTLRTIISLFNPKVILCEKPFTRNLKEAKKILIFLKKKKIKIFINYVRNSYPATIQLKRILKKKKITSYAFFSGSFINNYSHIYILFKFIFGEPLSFEILKNTTKTYFFLKIFFKNCILYASNKVTNNKERIIFNLKNKIINWYNRDELIVIKKGNKILKKIKADNKRGYQYMVAEQIKNYFFRKKYYLVDYKYALSFHKFYDSYEKIER